MDKEKNEWQNAKNAMAFIPLLAFVFYVIDKDRTDRFNKNLKYSLALLIAYIVFSIFFGIFVHFTVWLFFILYIWLSFYFWFRAYNWEDIDIEVLNDIFDKFNNKK